MRASALLLAVLTACNSIVDGNAASIPVKRLWFTPFSSPGAWPGLPAVDGGLVLVAGVGGMAAYDAATGQPRWQAQIWTGGQASFAGNIVTLGGLACIADYFGVGCAELATGHVRWTAATDQPTQDGEAAIDAKALYYGTAKHAVVARDLATGEILWTTDVNPGTAFLNPVFGVRLRGDTLFATTVRWQDRTGGTIVGDLVALARSDGRELWRYTAPSRSGFQGAPLLVDNLAILNDVYSHGLVAVDLTTHTVRWRTDVREDGYITAERPPILLGDTLYAGSTDTQVYAVDVHTGAYRWRVGTRAGSIGSTAVCGRLVLVVPFSGGPLNTVDRVRLVSDRPNVLDGDDLAGRIAVVGTTAYAAGTRGLYALSCPAGEG